MTNLTRFQTPIEPCGMFKASRDREDDKEIPMPEPESKPSPEQQYKEQFDTVLAMIFGG